MNLTDFILDPFTSKYKKKLWKILVNEVRCPIRLFYLNKKLKRNYTLNLQYNMRWFMYLFIFKLTEKFWWINSIAMESTLKKFFLLPAEYTLLPAEGSVTQTVSFTIQSSQPFQESSGKCSTQIQRTVWRFQRFLNTLLEKGQQHQGNLKKTL